MKDGLRSNPCDEVNRLIAGLTGPTTLSTTAVWEALKRSRRAAGAFETRSPDVQMPGSWSTRSSS